MRYFQPLPLTLTLSVLLAATALAGIAPAQTPPPAVAKPAKPPLTPIFLKGDTLDPALTLPAPPAPDSAAGRADLDDVRAVIRNSSPERIRQAAEDDVNETVALYSNVLPGLDLAKLPVTAAFFARVQNDQSYAAKKAKAFFARKRPFELDPSIPTCVPSAQGKAPTSYPSGHSTLGFTTGIILAHLIPAKAPLILARAQDYAESRVVCGVHFASDTVASQALSTGIAVELLQNPEFQKEYAAAKAELIAAGLTH